MLPSVIHSNVPGGSMTDGSPNREVNIPTNTDELAADARPNDLLNEKKTDPPHAELVNHHPEPNPPRTISRKGFYRSQVRRRGKRRT
ncbi:MAG: hypothetical protein NVSMB53_00960 [Gemmatimonadaceae bacterium]